MKPRDIYLFAKRRFDGAAGASRPRRPRRKRSRGRVERARAKRGGCTHCLTASRTSRTQASQMWAPAIAAAGSWAKRTTKNLNQGLQIVALRLPRWNANRNHWPSAVVRGFRERDGLTDPDRARRRKSKKRVSFFFVSALHVQYIDRRVHVHHARAFPRKKTKRARTQRSSLTSVLKHETRVVRGKTAQRVD